jgi:HEAT repeat protein
VARAAELASLGHATPPTADETAAAVEGLADDDARVRAAALGALVRTGQPGVLDAWCTATHDEVAAVRRRAAELAPALASPTTHTVVEGLLGALDDDDVTVVEAAAWALGEVAGGAPTRPGAVARLAATAVDHRDALAREAAVAALGAIGDRAGLEAILQATTDRPAVRRRAVLALAPFDGDEVDAALARALVDKDWQVRQAAEDLAPADDDGNQA